MGQRHDHVLLRHQVFLVELHRPLEVELGAAGIPVLLLQLVQVVLDQAVDLGLVLQEVFEIGDPLDDLPVLLFDLAPLQAGQPSQPHVDDCLRLALGELEALLHPLLCLLFVL